MGNAIRTIVCLLPILGAANGRAAEIRTATEEQVRAGFLFQLAQYAVWPADAFAAENSPLRFCVLGQDNLVETLQEAVRGKTIQGRSILISRTKEMGQLMGCHVAFIGFARGKQLREAFAKWAYPPVLLVGESEQFAELGGMVNLVIRSGRVSFEINLNAAGRARLEFRSQLLRFAKIIGGDERGTR